MEDNIQSFLGGVATGILLLIGLLIYTEVTPKHLNAKWELEAIRRGHAQYVTNLETGEQVFVWNKN